MNFSENNQFSNQTLSFVQRSQSNKILLVLYILLNLIVPMIFLFTSLGIRAWDWTQGIFGGVSRALFFFSSLPAFSVYAVMIIKDYFPPQNGKTLNYFIPFIANILLYIYSFYSLQEVYYSVLIFSIPFYLGLNLCFFLGIVYLIFQKGKGMARRDLIPRVTGTVLAMGLLFFPCIYFFRMGLALNLEIDHAPKALILLKYFGSILLVAFFHYKVIVSLYQRGKM